MDSARPMTIHHTSIIRTHVIGDPIAHSMSPIIFAAAGVGVHCTRTRVSAGSIHQFLASDTARESGGFSVTMPLKKEALAVCAHLDEPARIVQAINTLVPVTPSAYDTMDSDATMNPPEMLNLDTTQNPESELHSVNVRRFYGYNTDVTGIVQAVQEICGAEKTWRKGVILGSGATASSALAACMQLGIRDVTVCARRRSGADTVFAMSDRIGYPVSYVPFEDAADTIEQADLFISTLPAHIADPIARELRERYAGNTFSHMAVLDASYTVYPSALTQAVVACGGTNIPGYEMLIHQGLEQARLFTGREPDSVAVHKAIEAEIARRTACG